MSITCSGASQFVLFTKIY